MAQLATAEALKKAREARAAAKSKYEEIAGRLGSDEWDEAADGPALETEKRSWDDSQTLVDRLADKLEVEARSADGGGNGDGHRAPGVSIAILDPNHLGDNYAQKRREFRFLETIGQIVDGKALNGLSLEMHQEGVKESRELKLKDVKGDFTLPSWLVSSGQSSEEQRERAAAILAKNNIEARDILAGTATAGGHLVQTSVGGLIPVLEPKLVVMDMGATVLRNLTDNIDLPRNDAYGTATWEGEVDAAAETTQTFDKVSLSPERLAAFTQVSRRSIIQSKNVDVENFVRRDIVRAVKRALELAALNGSGSGNVPFGILATAGVNDINIGTDGGPLDWSLVVQFETETAIDDADFGRLGYLTTPGVAGHLKNLKRDIAGNGFIWEGPNGGGGHINGYGARVTTLMPSTLSKGSSGSILHAMIFGNWEELLIGQWGGVDVIVDPYTQKNNGMIEIAVNSYWDIALMHLASFCICNEIDIS